jgi:hypothetical protein
VCKPVRYVSQTSSSHPNKSVTPLYNWAVLIHEGISVFAKRHDYGVSMKQLTRLIFYCFLALIAVLLLGGSFPSPVYAGSIPQAPPPSSSHEDLSREELEDASVEPFLTNREDTCRLYGKFAANIVRYREEGRPLTTVLARYRQTFPEPELAGLRSTLEWIAQTIFEQPNKFHRSAKRVFELDCLKKTPTSPPPTAQARR